MSTSSNPEVAQTQFWLEVIGLALMAQAQKVSLGFPNGTKCSICRGPKLAVFDSGEMVDSPHYLIDAKLEEGATSFGGTFLLPSPDPEASPKDYIAVRDEITGINHVARKGTVVQSNMPGPRSDPTQAYKQRRQWSKAQAQIKGVEMPSEFNALSKSDCTDMPAFGFIEETESNSCSISIMDSFKGVFDNSGDKPTYNNISNSAVGNNDDAIVDIGRPLLEVSQTCAIESPGFIAPPFGGGSADTIFFESLLKWQSTVEEVSPVAESLELDAKSKDSLFFESLMAKGQINEVASDLSSLLMANQMAGDVPDATAQATTLVELEQHVCKSALQLESGCSDFEDSVLSGSTDEYKPAIIWMNISTLSLSSISALDLALPNHKPKPRPILSELHLDMTTDQVDWLSQSPGVFAEPGNDETVASMIPSAEDEVSYYQPVSPRKNELPYEAYFCPTSPSSSVSSSDAHTSSSSVMTSRRPSTGASSVSNSKDNMFVFFKQEPLDTILWLDLATTYDRSEYVQHRTSTNEDDLLLSPTTVNDEGSQAGLPIASLPLIDQQGGDDFQNTSVTSEPSLLQCCNDAQQSKVESDDGVFVVELPEQSLETLPADTKTLRENPESALQTAIKALDVATVFGENAEDWSDEPDFDAIALDDEPERALNPDKSSDQEKSMDHGVGHEVETIVAEVTLEVPASMPPVNDSVEPIPSRDTRPLIPCYRLPALLIKTINLEYCSIWDSEGPWTDGVDEAKVYELAVENVRKDNADIQDDILFWVREVNGEFSRLGMQSQADSTSWGYQYDFEQIMALALSNVEWHYFAHCLNDLPKLIPNETLLEYAESPRDWIMKMLGADANQCQPIHGTENASPEQHEPTAKSLDNGGPAQTKINDDSLNTQLKTLAFSPFWSTCSPKFRQCFDATDLCGQPGHTSVRSDCQHRHHRASPLVNVFSVDDLELDSDDEEASDTTLAVAMDENFDEDFEDSAETSAPVTPALLLQMPNRSTEKHDANDTIDVKTDLCDEENPSEVSTEIEDFDVHSIHDYSNTLSSDGNRIKDSNILEATGTSPFLNKLRRHGFFPVDTPEKIASSILLFPAQTAMQSELNLLMEDFPEDCFPIDEEEDIDTGELLATVELPSETPKGTVKKETPEKAESRSTNAPAKPATRTGDSKSSAVAPDSLIKDKQPPETLWQQYPFPKSEQPGTGKPSHLFVDRAKPTPTRPPKSGSLGDVVLGALYIGIELLRWVL